MKDKWYEKSGQQGDVAVSTRIRLARNLSDIPFPCKLSVDQRFEVAEKIKSALENSNSYIADTFEYIHMDEISDIKCASLMERHLISPQFTKDRKGKFLLLTKDESISIMINEEDHIRIQVMKEGLSLAQAYETADKIDTLLDNALKFAFHNKLGYLTQCPTNLGTGLRASVMLHLPALQGRRTIVRLENNLSKLGLTLRGTFGEGTDPKGALYQLSNQVTLGLSEQAAIDNLKNVAMQIITQERSAREALKENIETVDYINRSLGTLKWAVLLSGDEAMQRLSAVRMGVAAGLIKDIDLDTINGLMTELQPATLAEQENKELSPTERDILRAKKVKEIL